jgi:hypothetical protein
MSLTHPQAVSLTLGGTAGLVASGIYAWSIETFREKAKRASGEVIDLIEDLSSNDGPTYSPSFRFTTPDGEVWKVTSFTGTNPAVFSVGDRVTVLYDPANPAKARIDSVTQLWTGPVVFGIIAAVALFIGMQALLSE